MSRPTDPSPDLPRCSWRFPSPTATLAAGAALARAFAEAEAAGELDGPLVVALAGPLGAGKTQLAKGVGAGFGSGVLGIGERGAAGEIQFHQTVLQLNDHPFGRFSTHAGDLRDHPHLSFDDIVPQFRRPHRRQRRQRQTGADA